MSDVPEKTGRVQGGKFAPGVSGNPRGRPKGSRNQSTLVLAELLDGEGELIVRKAIEQAKTGDPVAMRLLVPRLLPRLERRLQFDLQRVENAGAVAGAVADVIALASSGELTIDEARAFLGLLEQQRRAIETAELADRLAALEEEQQKRGARRWD